MMHLIPKFSFALNVLLPQIFLLIFRIIRVRDLALILFQVRQAQKNENYQMPLILTRNLILKKKEYTLTELARLIKRKGKNNKESFATLTESLNDMKKAQDASISTQNTQ